MKTFIYRYEDRPGHIVQGKMRANAIGQANSLLKKKRIHPITIKEDKGTFFERFFTEKNVRPDDLVSFSQLFASCIETGLTIKESLGLLVKQVESKLLQNRLSDIITDIEGGTSISNSFSKHTDVFPPFFPMLLKAGEASGDLATVLDYTGKYMERINNLKKELTGVFTYPAIVSTVGLGLLGLILVFVAPTFKEVFSESGVPLPFPTHALFFLSDIVGTYYPVLITIVSIVSLTYFLLNRNIKGKKLLHSLQMKIPLIGQVIKQALMLRFLRAFDILINNNVPILEALKVLEQGTDNLCFKDVITEMRQDVSKGLPISGPIIRAKELFPALISNSIAMGEKSGTLGSTVGRLGNFVDREINFTMKKVSSKLDPILTLGMGSMVLFIALAIYLPIFDMMGAAQ
jgi:type IV pilus assembly protein PilC